MAQKVEARLTPGDLGGSGALFFNLFCIPLSNGRFFRSFCNKCLVVFCVTVERRVLRLILFTFDLVRQIEEPFALAWLVTHYSSLFAWSPFAHFCFFYLLDWLSNRVKRRCLRVSIRLLLQNTICWTQRCSKHHKSALAPGKVVL